MADWITLAVTTISTVVVAVLAACLGYFFQQRHLKHERKQNNQDHEHERERNKQDLENERERINRDLEIKRAEDFYKELAGLMENLYFQMKYKMLMVVKKEDGTKTYVKKTVKKTEPELDVEASEENGTNADVNKTEAELVAKASEENGTNAGDKKTEAELDVEAFEQAKANWWARQIYNHMMVTAVFGGGEHGVDIQQNFLEVHRMFKKFSQDIEDCKPEENFRGRMQMLRLYIRKCNLTMMDAIQREDVGGEIPNKKTVAKDIAVIQADIVKELKESA